MKYRERVVIEATRWFKNGDHPLDDVFRPFEDTGEIPTEPREGAIVRYFRHPDIDGEKVCEFCKFRMNDHGWIDGVHKYKVCVGDWIIAGSGGEYYPLDHQTFDAAYEPAE